MVERIAIVGPGLIGGSFALALREAGYRGHITAIGRNRQALLRAVERGIANDFETAIDAAIPAADLVLLAVPVGAMEPLLKQIAAVARPDTIVTDAGSVKQHFIDAARRQMPSIENVVPAHPIAGTEHSGVEAGFAELYRGRRLILTPLPETSPLALDEVDKLWRMTGAVIETMDPKRHDHVFAATSHLPHLLAFSLVESLNRMQQQDEVLRYAAGGFSDFTRIASSDPVMWRDICLHNRDAVLGAFDQLQHGLSLLRAAIANQDASEIERTFAIAKETRDALLAVSKPEAGSQQES